jgi:hypothetical protein
MRGRESHSLRRRRLDERQQLVESVISHLDRELAPERLVDAGDLLGEPKRGLAVPVQELLLQAAQQADRQGGEPLRCRDDSTLTAGVR